jgi:Fic family protein
VLFQHAADKMLELVFHSNKIEGNSLSKGETRLVLEGHNQSGLLTPPQREAKNLEQAYRWMLANV